MTREEEKELEKQMAVIKQKLKESEKQKKLDRIASHKEYIGKCYKHIGWENDEDLRYRKILSEVSENEYHVECFEFSLPVFYRYEEKLCMTSDRYPDAKIECEPFEFVSRGIFCSNSDIEEWVEITADEFNVARDECYRQMIAITNKVDFSDEILTK